MSKDIITQPDLRLAAEPLITREQFMAKYLAEHDLPQHYWDAPKKEKTAILDDAEAATGYHRKSLIRLLKRLRDRAVQLAAGAVERVKTIGRPLTYLDESKKTL